jgi:hypothetical protein
VSLGTIWQVSESPEQRIREAKETQEVLERVHPAAHPSAEDVAALHELHAAHERRHGRIDAAEEAEARARRARGRA